MPRSSKKIDELLHDIKSPLTSAIISCEETLEIVNDQETLRKDSIIEYLRDIHESLQCIKNLVSTDTYDEKFDVREVISSSIKSAKKISLNTCEIRLSSPDIAIYGSRTKFRRVINNLLLNAVEAFATNIDIKVEAKSSMEIRISDNGIGIPKDKLEYIFDKGYSLKTSKFKTSRNHGLGLCICKSIIEKDFGGEITVESSIGSHHGTVFTIRVAPIKCLDLA